MTRNEIVSRAVEEIMELSNRDMMEPSIVELVVLSAVLECENAAVDRQLTVVQKQLEALR